MSCTHLSPHVLQQFFVQAVHARLSQASSGKTFLAQKYDGCLPNLAVRVLLAILKAQGSLKSAYKQQLAN